MTKVTYLSKLQGYLQSVDIYGRLITLTYNKQSKFKTSCGGFMTLIVVCGILSFFLYSVQDIQNHQYTVTSRSTRRDVLRDTSIYNLTQDDYDFAIQIVNIGNSTVNLEMETYFQIRAHYVTKTPANNLSLSHFITTRELEFIRCPPGRFGEIDYQAQALGLTNFYWCVKDIGPTQLQGNINTVQAMSQTLAVDYCNQTVLDSRYPGQNKTCKTEDEINQVMDRCLVQYYYTNKFFDLQEFEVYPVKRYLKLQSFVMTVGSASNLFIQVEQHNALIQDSKITSFYSPQNITYYTYDNQDFAYTVGYTLATKYVGNAGSYGWSLLAIGMESPATISIQQRQVVTILDIVSQTGGLAGVFNLIGALISQLFFNSFFYSDIMPKLIHHKKNKSNKKNKAQNETEQKIMNSFNQSPQKMDETAQKIEDIDWKIAQDPNSLISQAIICIQNQVPFIIKAKNILYYEIRKIFGSIYICRKKTYQDHNQQNNLYENSLNLLQREFDIVNIVKKIRSIEIIQSLILNNSQIRLMTYLNNYKISKKKQINIDAVNQIKSEQSDKDFNEYLLQKDIEKAIQQAQTKQKIAKLLNRILGKTNKMSFLKKKLIPGDDKILDVTDSLKLMVQTQNMDKKITRGLIHSPSEEMMDQTQGMDITPRNQFYSPSQRMKEREQQNLDNVAIEFKYSTASFTDRK